MSYAQAMRWQKQHVRGTRQPVLMHTGSGFWPSAAWTQEYLAYIAACKAIETEPLEGEDYYRRTCRGRMMSGMTIEGRAEYTKLRRARMAEEGVEF